MTVRVICLFLATATAALAIAMHAPLATTVLGLMAFGVLHNVLELRYVAGRFASVLSGQLLVLLIALITAIVLCRLAAVAVGQPARLAEIVIGYAVLGAVCVAALRGPLRALALATWRSPPRVRSPGRRITSWFLPTCTTWCRCSSCGSGPGACPPHRCGVGSGPCRSAGCS